MEKSHCTAEVKEVYGETSGLETSAPADHHRPQRTEVASTYIYLTESLVLQCVFP